MKNTLVGLFKNRNVLTIIEITIKLMNGKLILNLYRTYIMVKMVIKIIFWYYI